MERPMDHHPPVGIPSVKGPGRGRAGLVSAAPLAAEELARTFGIDNLPERLAAVDETVTRTLRGNDALLGPAAVRMADAGGKRLRPLFTVVSAALGDVFDDRVVAVAAAVELVQVGSLVHDDILDDAAVRRGRPTINAAEGVSHAVLAGDYILARAAELAASASQEAAGLLAKALGSQRRGAPRLDPRQDRRALRVRLPARRPLR
jgi:heptaprenyl diphosphate synthase